MRFRLGLIPIEYVTGDIAEWNRSIVTTLVAEQAELSECA